MPVRQLVVVGGGYAGLQVVLRVQARCGGRCRITLLERNPWHQLITRLPELVGSGISPNKARIPYRRLLGTAVEHVQAEVTRVMPERLTAEAGGREYAGDQLVVALGSAPDWLGIPGAQARAFPVRSVAQAEALRRRLQEGVARGRRLHVVIVGAGYTGTEVAGELASWDAALRLKGQPGLHVMIVAPEPHLLMEADPRLGAAAREILEGKGVQFQLRTQVHAVEDGRVLIRPGTACPADIVVWATRAEVAGPRLPGLPAVTPEGRIAVDPFLRVPHHENLYLAGDEAAPYDYRLDAVVPPSAQMAVEEGAVLGTNLAAAIDGGHEREFRPHRLGDVLALGGRDGVAEVSGVIVRGRAALALKRAALGRYLYRLGGTSLVRDYA